MQPFPWRKLVVVSSIAIIGGLGFWNIYRAEAQSATGADYILVNQNLEMTAQPETAIPVIVAIRNLTKEAWPSDKLQLGTIFSTSDKDRNSVWTNDSWLSATRIGLHGTGQPIYPNKIATFAFTMKVPAYHGMYKEYFMPIMEGARWLDGVPIVFTFIVGGEVQIQAAIPTKEVRIYRKTQQAEWLEDGYVVATLPISSGKSGYATPAGQYKIMNHILNAYSSEYKLWMPNWMGLSSNKYGFLGYGMHALPYWNVNPARYEEGKIYPGGRLYTQGRLYEGYSHLGVAVSHGCVRWGIREAEIMYNWAPEGTPVIVV